jgi:signal transduction histidine kinase
MSYIQTTFRPSSTIDLHLWPVLDFSNDFWMTLLDNLPFQVLVFQTDGQLLLINKEAEANLGLEGLEGHKLPDYLYPLKKAINHLNNYAYGCQVTINTLLGSEVNFLVKNLPGYSAEGAVLAVSQEKFSAPLPEVKETIEESVAMADAVSQQVKGPLAGIELCASILGEELHGSGDFNLTDLIEEIRYSVREVNEYLTSFESMTRPLILDLKPQNLADVVDEALLAMNGVFKANGIGVLVDQKDVTVEMDRGLMVQLFLNLFLNAAEAMGQGGRLHVNFQVNRQGQAEVIVTDTGPGVSLRDMKKIFNPFFTTKNQPLGLGLPVSQRIIESHQGSLIVGTNGEYGARAVVVMPCIPDPENTGLDHTLN